MGIRENIIQLRELFGVTQEQLASIAGVSRGAVSQWEGGFSEPRMGSIQKIADHFRISKSNIIEDNGMSFIDPVTKKPKGSPYMPSGAMPVVASSATVPLLTLGRVHAGSLADEEEVAHRVEVPASVCAGHPRAFALEVEGDCMNRVIPEGSHVLVDPDRQPANGSIAVVETEDYRAVMRRWYKGSTKLMLSADSFKDYEDMIFGMDDGLVRVIGTVVWFQAADEME